MSSFQNLVLSLNVEVDPQTDVRVMIDPYAGDYLEVKGGGRISYGIDPGGRMSMSGRYELTEGTYLLTFYDVLRRQFAIRRGSSISWTGDPANPEVDITAVYTIRTSARELFESQMQSASATDQRYRQQFPFQVLLEMKGSLSHPDIRFEILLPPEHQQALDGRLQSRLQDMNQNESELNKQVFALLIYR
jgi:translocation and assembly module TamB